MGHRPNAHLVAVAWVRGIGTIDPTKVASTRPKNRSLWADYGFIQVGPVVGGSPDLHVPQRISVVEVSCWAINLNSSKPPWGKANQLAELVLNHPYSDPAGGGRDVSALLPTGYDGARVQCVYPNSEPREFEGDTASAALYKFELTINWTALT